MKKSGYVALMIALGFVFSADLMSARAGVGSSALAEIASQAVLSAEIAMDEAKSSIENGMKLIALIPADSPQMKEIRQALQASSDNWASSIGSLEGARRSASKIDSAYSPEVSHQYKLLAQMNAAVALSGAKVVQVSILFVESVADNKTEALDIILAAMPTSLEAAEQARLCYERVKTIIAERYSGSASIFNADLAKSNWMLAQVSIATVLANVNLAMAARDGDIDAITKAQKHASAVGADLAVASEAYTVLEGGDKTADKLMKDIFKRVCGSESKYTKQSENAKLKNSQENAGAGPASPSDPVNIYDVPWETDGMRQLKQELWDQSNFGDNGDRDATQE